MSFFGRKKRELFVIYADDKLAPFIEEYAKKLEKFLSDNNIKLEFKSVKLPIKEYDPAKTILANVDPRAKELIEKLQIRGFPCLILDEKLISHGALPTSKALAKALGIKAEQIPQELKDALSRFANAQAQSTLEMFVGTPKIERVAVKAETPKQIIKEITESAKTEEITAQMIETVRKLSKTGFSWPENCANCLYYNEENKRCGLLHADVFDVFSPLCRKVLSKLS